MRLIFSLLFLSLLISTTSYASWETAECHYLRIYPGDCYNVSNGGGAEIINVSATGSMGYDGYGETGQKCPITTQTFYFENDTWIYNNQSLYTLYNTPTPTINDPTGILDGIGTEAPQVADPCPAPPSCDQPGELTYQEVADLCGGTEYVGFYDPDTCSGECSCYQEALDFCNDTANCPYGCAGVDPYTCNYDCSDCQFEAQRCEQTCADRGGVSNFECAVSTIAGLIAVCECNEDEPKTCADIMAECASTCEPLGGMSAESYCLTPDDYECICEISPWYDPDEPNLEPDEPEPDVPDNPDDPSNAVLQAIKGNTDTMIDQGNENNNANTEINNELDKQTSNLEKILKAIKKGLGDVDVNYGNQTVDVGDSPLPGEENVYAPMELAEQPEEIVFLDSVNAYIASGLPLLSYFSDTQINTTNSSSQVCGPIMGETICMEFNTYESFYNIAGAFLFALSSLTGFFIIIGRG